MNQPPNRFRLLLRLSRPQLLIAGILPVLLGTAIVQYLGNRVDWTLFWFGLLWVISVQLGAHYLHEYFDLYVEPNPEDRTWFFGGSQVLGTGEGKLPRRTALVAAMGAWTITGTIATLIFSLTTASLDTLILMLLVFSGALVICIPPVRLYRSGYGELILALIFGFLIPAFSFALQVGGSHRLITMTALPLVLLIIPVLLALEFPYYSSDLKHDRMNMLQKIGWQNSMVVHDTLILLAYLSMAANFLMGFPRSIGLMTFLSLPAGLIQIWLMRRIADGAKPIWSAIRFNVISMVGLMMFTLIFSFWTR